jgi:crotonobetainyl-CoA:carnitine CoA-transferase CaiB-like acyl-CoA transferase
LEAGIANWTASLAAEAVQESLQARGVAAHLVATVADIEHDPQLLHRGHWWETDHAVIGPMTYDGAAYRLSETRAEANRGAPLMGEHNAYVYREVMGYSEDELAELVAAGVVS